MSTPPSGKCERLYSNAVFATESSNTRQPCPGAVLGDEVGRGDQGLGFVSAGAREERRGEAL